VIPSAALRQIAAYGIVPSTISNHGQPCCTGTLAWMRGVDASNSYRDGHWHPPTWLRKQYEWGPVAWPLHWCSVPDMKKLDCGGLAAVAVELYRLRGQAAVPVQLALRYPEHAAEQWSRMWERHGLNPSWITGEFCYHEVCGVVEGEELLLWDPTESRWLDPPVFPNEAFASVMALNVVVPSSDHRTIRWRGIPIPCGVWQSLVFDAEGRLTTACT